MGVRWGGEAYAAAQPTTRGRSRRHNRRCFGRLEQEDQRLKKHYDRWMDIVQSLGLESFILTKLTKPFVLVNLVGPLYWVPANRGSIHFFVRNKEALPCVRRCSWWVPVVRGKCFLCEIQWPVWWVPTVRWRNNYFARNKEALPCCGRGPSCQPLHVQSTSNGSRSLTTLTMPCREHQGGGRRRGLGRGRRGAGEDAAVEARAERSTSVHWFSCGVRLPSLQNNKGYG